MSNKPPIGPEGPSDFQRLKALPWEEHELLWSMREQMSAAKILGQIRARHGLVLLAQRLSDYWRWLETQRALREMNEDAETFRQQFLRENPESTLEEAHEQTLAWLHLRAARGDDEKLMKFCLGEIRKARSLAHVQEKWRAELKSKLEAGLEALFAEIKDNPRAVGLFEAMKREIAA